VDSFSVLNYQGSKKNLINFIHESAYSLLSSDDTLLDIFSGTCSVGYSFKRNLRVMANDCEEYAFHISNALLQNTYKYQYNHIREIIENEYSKISQKQSTIYRNLAVSEEDALQSKSLTALKNLYLTVPLFWTSDVSDDNNSALFTSYYATTYFGIKQSLEIDALRLVIETFADSQMFSILMTSLFFAMKECVFAKDGHMAQPLDLTKNSHKLLKQRSKSIYNIFMDKLSEFFQPHFVQSAYENRVFNLPFEQLLEYPQIQNDVSVIYADPPYTDMQYSRYYHLLNFITRYKKDSPTLIRGEYTKGLYTDNRYQSVLSSKSSCLQSFAKLVKFSKYYNKRLIISFAYPSEPTQKTDRYVMSINDLAELCRSTFDSANVDIADCDYLHSNNRNSTQKKVREYLIMCK
jgi:adenine-specific DNA methylase